MSNPIKTLKAADKVLQKSKELNEEPVKRILSWYKVNAKHLFSGADYQRIMSGYSPADVSNDFINFFGRIFNIVSIERVGG